MMLPEETAEEILPSVESIRGLGGRESPYLGALKSGGKKASTEDPVKAQVNLYAGNRDPSMGIQLSRVDRRHEEIVIPVEAVAEERGYWDLALIGYVLGTHWICSGGPDSLLSHGGVCAFSLEGGATARNFSS
ncbi:hypothetical protein Dimus_038034 [Dionaea muscipula]